MSEPKTAPLTPARLEEAEQVIAKATPGPWRIADYKSGEHDHENAIVGPERQARHPDDYNAGVPELVAIRGDAGDAHGVFMCQQDADNAEFIALSRTLLPDLLAVVRGLLALGPEIDREIREVDAEELPPSCACNECRYIALLRQVRALIEGGA